MLKGKLFVICGVSRLSGRVARSLCSANASVTVIMYDGDSQGVAALLPPEVTLIKSSPENAAETLRSVHVADAECMLALSEGDLDNLRSTVCARSVAPKVPVVIRAFDPRLADQFEQGLNVRRAFSVSALAAPAFAAAACGANMIESLRLGDEVVPINVLKITAQSPLKGQRLDTLRQTWGVAFVGLRHGTNPWILHRDLHPGNELRPGDEVIVSGSPKGCMNMLAYAAGWHLRRAMVSSHGRRGSVTEKKKKHRRQSTTWLPQIAAILSIIILSSIAVFKVELHLTLVNAIYFVITTVTTTGFGDISLMNSPDWVKMYGGLIMLSGGALLGISFSYLASIVTAERLDVMMEKRAERMSNHIVVVGMGNVGYRVTMALTDLGLDVAVLELAPNPQFLDAISRRAPVLAGDARLPETLERVAITEAAAIIAATSNDLVNVEACLQAKRMNPKIQTVARVYDDQIVETLSAAFGIDSVLSATHIADSSFVMAATDSAALRTIKLPGLTLSACRYRVEKPIEASQVKEWENAGIQSLAFRSEDGAITSTLTSPSTYQAIICGSEEALRSLVGGKTSFTPSTKPGVSVAGALKNAPADSLLGDPA